MEGPSASIALEGNRGIARGMSVICAEAYAIATRVELSRSALLETVHRFGGSNHINIINQLRPEERALSRASRKTATGDVVPVSILRDAVLRHGSSGSRPRD